MRYFRNYELADLYHVSRATVGKWVEAVKQGKLDLVLYEHGDKSYIANTTGNITTIEQLVEGRRKYRNGRGFKVITPRPEFYRLYNQGQVYDIVRNLERYHEIPREYNYFDGGANNWDTYVQRLATDSMPNTFTSTLGLLDKNSTYIDGFLAGYKRVNIVDLGVGNALPVKQLLQRLLAKELLGRYIGIDISASMLEIARRNISDWFGERVKFEGYEMDLTRDHFANILAEEYTREDSAETINLVLFLGGTLSNMRDPEMVLKVISDSMGVSDLLIHSQRLDTENSRKYFDFSSKPNPFALSLNHRFIFDLLKVDESFYDVEMGYDDSTRHRFVRLRLKVAVAINFEFDEGQRTVELNKGETILLWRAWQNDASDVAQLLGKGGFDWLHASQTDDQEFILTVSRPKQQL